MDIPKESSRSYSHLPQGSLEVNHGHNGFSNLEVVPPIAPEAYGCPEPDQKVSHTHGKAPERRRVCGVTPLNFWIMIFALIIILAAGLGGGLGAGLSRTNSSDRNGNPDNNSAALLTPTSLPTAPTRVAAPHTTTPTAPSRSTTGPSPAGMDVTCPDNDTLVYTPPSNTAQSTSYFLNDTTLTYTIHCNQTYYQSEDISDIQYIKNSNLSSCIQSCSIYNIQFPNGGGEYGFYNLCSGITVTDEGVCQLKEGVEVGAVGANRTGGRVQSAVLLW